MGAVFRVRNTIFIILAIYLITMIFNLLNSACVCSVFSPGQSHVGILINYFSQNTWAIYWCYDICRIGEIQ